MFRILLFIFVFSLIIFNSFSYQNISSCDDDPTAPGEYRLNQDIANLTGGGCLFFDHANSILDCQGYNIVGNGTSGNGITLGDVNITVQNCNIYNFSYGAFLDSGSYNSTVNNNNFYSNNIGLYLGYNAENIVSNNYFQGNNRALRLSSTSDNLVYGNEFVSNNNEDINFINSAQNNTIYLNEFENSSYLTGAALSLNYFNSSTQGNFWGDFNGTLPFCFSGICDNFATYLNSNSITNTNSIFPNFGFFSLISFSLIFWGVFL